MISKLELKNFRCFQDFTLDGIRPVTLIAGKNNVGKSALLEGVSIYINRFNPNILPHLDDIRGQYEKKLTPKIGEWLFNDTKKELTVSAVEDSAERFVSFAVDCRDIMRSDESYRLNAVYDNPEKNFAFQLYKGEIAVFSPDGKMYSTPREYDYFSIQYIDSAKLFPEVNAELFGKIELNGDKPKCVELLKNLESRIVDLSVIVANNVPAIYANIDVSRRLPITMLGGGINKLMRIAFAMLAYPGEVILIDEIENGFHYSFFPKLWEILGKLAKETGCQIFATTHSSECIDGAVQLATDTANPDLFRYVRLDNIDGVVVPKVFENDSFEYAINNNWERITPSA